MILTLPAFNHRVQGTLIVLLKSEFPNDVQNNLKVNDSIKSPQNMILAACTNSRMT